MVVMVRIKDEVRGKIFWSARELVATDAARRKKQVTMDVILHCFQD